MDVPAEIDSDLDVAGITLFAAWTADALPFSRRKWLGRWHGWRLVQLRWIFRQPAKFWRTFPKRELMGGSHKGVRAGIPDTDEILEV